MIGTIAVSEFGAPVTPSPLGPSHPSAPMIHISENSSPEPPATRMPRSCSSARPATSVLVAALGRCATVPPRPEPR